MKDDSLQHNKSLQRYYSFYHDNDKKVHFVIEYAIVACQKLMECSDAKMAAHHGFRLYFEFLTFSTSQEKLIFLHGEKKKRFSQFFLFGAVENKQLQQVFSAAPKRKN